MKHLGTKYLASERLFLRRLTVKDAEDMFQNWASEEEVVKFLTWKKYESVKEVEPTLAMWEEMYQNDEFYQWGIELKEIGELIGTISCVRLNNEIQGVEIGYCIGTKWWGKGVVAEALSEIIKFFFEEVKVNVISAKHDVRNPNSGKVMTKCNMVYKETRRGSDFNNQGICDSKVYSISASEYFEKKMR